MCGAVACVWTFSVVSFFFYVFFLFVISFPNAALSISKCKNTHFLYFYLTVVQVSGFIKKKNFK